MTLTARALMYYQKAQVAQGESIWAIATHLVKESAPVSHTLEEFTVNPDVPAWALRIKYLQVNQRIKSSGDKFMPTAICQCAEGTYIPVDRAITVLKAAMCMEVYPDEIALALNAKEVEEDGVEGWVISSEMWEATHQELLRLGGSFAVGAYPRRG